MSSTLSAFVLNLFHYIFVFILIKLIPLLSYRQMAPGGGGHQKVKTGFVVEDQGGTQGPI